MLCFNPTTTPYVDSALLRSWYVSVYQGTMIHWAQIVHNTGLRNLHMQVQSHLYHTEQKVSAVGRFLKYFRNLNLLYKVHVVASEQCGMPCKLNG